MERSERGAASDDGCLWRAVVPDERDHFMKDVFIELVVSDGLMCRFHLGVHPTFIVDAVNGEQFHAASIDHGSQCFDQLKAFIFEVVGRCGRYHQQGETVMTIGCHGHVFLKRGTEPTGDFALHVFSSRHKSTFCS